jgi:hypothetical protein
MMEIPNKKQTKQNKQVPNPNLMDLGDLKKDKLLPPCY